MRLLILSTLLAIGPPQPAQPTSEATLADLAWLTGQWVGGGPDRSEEIWAPPAGDSMMGMWRLVAGGETRVFELLAITQEPEGPVYWLRHFTRQFVAWEEKDRPLRLPLVRHTAGKAVFEGTGSDGALLRLTYRQPRADALTVLLEHGEKRSTFEFTRAAELVAVRHRRHSLR